MSFESKCLITGLALIGLSACNPTAEKQVEKTVTVKVPIPLSTSTLPSEASRVELKSLNDTDVDTRAYFDGKKMTLAIEECVNPEDFLNIIVNFYPQAIDVSLEADERLPYKDMRRGFIENAKMEQIDGKDMCVSSVELGDRPLHQIIGYKGSFGAPDWRLELPLTSEEDYVDANRFDSLSELKESDYVCNLSSRLCYENGKAQNFIGRLSPPNLRLSDGSIFESSFYATSRFGITAVEEYFAGSSVSQLSESSDDKLGLYKIQPVK